MSVAIGREATTQDETNFLIANRLLDFVDFLREELGDEWVRELEEQFDAQPKSAKEHP